MTIALESMLGGLRDSNYSAANPTYTAETLTSAAEFSKNLREIDPTTNGGLQKYRETTGLQTADRTTGAIELELKQISAEINKGLGDYISKHAEPTAKEIEEQRRAEIAYTFSPEDASKIPGSTQYKTAAETVSKAKAEITTIKKDPVAYITKKIADAPDFMRGIVGRFQNEVLEIDIESAQRTAFQAIAGVGSTEKFIALTHQGLSKLETDYTAELEKIRTDETAKRRNMPTHFNAEEEANYLGEINERKAKLQETEADFVALPELTNALFSESVAAIKKRTAQAPTQS